jgi:hypothetical protein
VQAEAPAAGEQAQLVRQVGMRLKSHRLPPVFDTAFTWLTDRDTGGTYPVCDPGFVFTLICQRGW